MLHLELEHKGYDDRSLKVVVYAVVIDSHVVNSIMKSIEMATNNSREEKS